MRIPLFAFGLQNGPNSIVILRRPLVGFSDSSLSMCVRKRRDLYCFVILLHLIVKMELAISSTINENVFSTTDNENVEIEE